VSSLRGAHLHLLHLIAAFPVLDPHTTMADANPELQAKLQELEHELEEGDITKKGCVSSGRCKRRRIRTPQPQQR